MNDDSHKLSFDLPSNISDMLYRQTLIMSGLPYSPGIVFLAVLFSFFVFFLKKVQIMFFSRRALQAITIEQQTK